MKRFLLFLWLLSSTLPMFAQNLVLVWSDEFDGAGPPDPNKWGYDLGAGGWGNNEVQTYTNSTQNSRQYGGVLVIEALKQGNTWTSARLQTNNKFEFKYGSVIFRARLPVGSGTWPALWMLGENFGTVGWPACGEIDVMEHVGKYPGVVSCAMHTPSSYGNTVNTAQKIIPTFNTEFHNYQVTWTYSKIEIRIDSILYYTYSPAVRNTKTWPYDKPFFLIMNIAMGGNMGSDPQYETGGKKNGIDPALTSAKMEIDYVRVYQSPIGIDDARGSNEHNNNDQPLLFPNPSDGKISIALDHPDAVEGIIYNIHGKDVHRFRTTDAVTDIDLTFLPKGIYFLSATTDNTTMVQKILLQ